MNITQIAALLALTTTAASAHAAPPHDGLATYTITFDSAWSSATHPGAFPANAHYSPLIGAVHTPATSFWAPGGIASQGIESMAETGATTALRGEVNAAIGAGTARAVLNGPALNSPDMATISATLDPTHSAITLVTMIAPSPDWFVGVDGLELMENGRWVDEVTVPLFAWDAGTDSGPGFTSSNQNTSPQDPIALLTSGPFFAATPLATLTVRRVRATTTFGAGVNEPGTIDILGEPRIGQTLTFRLSDPNGVIQSPAITFLAVSSTLQPSVVPLGIGRVLPGTGLAGPNSDGELLIDNPLVRMPGPDYTGTPVDHVLEMPTSSALAGMEFYVQGVFFSPSDARIGLTEAVQVVPSL